LPSFKNGDYKKALEESYIKVDELLLTPEVNKKLATYSNSDEGGAQGWG
jgi:predicted component of type VI protein secretion system